jgi:hypothetical protein
MLGSHRNQLAVFLFSSAMCSVLLPIACGGGESDTVKPAQATAGAGAGSASVSSSDGTTLAGLATGVIASVGSGGAAQSSSAMASSSVGQGGAGVLTHKDDFTFGGSVANDSVTVNDVAVDKKDNIIAVGSFKGSIDFDGPGGLPADGAGDVQGDLFIAKYGSDGKLLWRKALGSSNIQNAIAVAVDANNRVAVCGFFFGTLNFGGNSLTATGNMFADAFVALFDEAGTHISSMRWGSLADGATDHCYDVAFDASGNVIATGKYQKSAIFGNTTLTTKDAGGIDVVLAKLQPNMGTKGFDTLFAKSFGDINADVQEGHAVAVAPNGDIALAGYSNGPIDFGGGKLTPPNIDPLPTQPFVALLDSNGSQKWAKMLASGKSGTDDAEGRSVAFHSNNDLIFGGTFRTQIDTGKEMLKATGASSDAFVVRYDMNGTPVFGVRVGGNQSDELASLAVDGQGFPVFAGKFQDNLVLNAQTTLKAGGNFDMALIRLANDDGHGYAGIGAGDGQYQDATGVALDTKGNIVVVGNFQGAIKLGMTAKTAPNGSQSFFIARYSP